MILVCETLIWLNVNKFLNHKLISKLPNSTRRLILRYPPVHPKLIIIISTEKNYREIMIKIVI